MRLRGTRTIDSVLPRRGRARSMASICALARTWVPSAYRSVCVSRRSLDASGHVCTRRSSWTERARGAVCQGGISPTHTDPWVVGAKWQAWPVGEGDARTDDVFLSYSRHLDAQIAASLEHGLQRFAKPWYRARALRVFRDASSLSARIRHCGPRSRARWPTPGTSCCSHRLRRPLRRGWAARCSGGWRTVRSIG